MKKTIVIAVAVMGITGSALAGCSQSTSVTNADTAQILQETTSSADPGGQSTQAVNASYKQITQDEALKMINEGSDYIILDVRTESEYAGGHIPYAICIPNETIDENVVSRLPDKEQTILVYCRSGNRSKQASEKLADLGYINVYEFGGINTWSGDIVK